MIEGNTQLAKEYSPLKLIKNKEYPSYHLSGTIEGNKITTEEAFKICILETMYWIRQKFENIEIPEELKSVLPSQYKEFSLENIYSFYLDRGYIIEVVYLDSEKSWNFQLVEPDLGAGENKPVAGRVFRTDISFRIFNNTILCAFSTKVSEPENCTETVISLRNGVIKLIVRNSLLNLSHISIPIKEQYFSLNSETRLKFISQSIENKARTLPLIVFAEYKQTKDNSKIQNIENKAKKRLSFLLSDNKTEEKTLLNPQKKFDYLGDIFQKKNISLASEPIKTGNLYDLNDIAKSSESIKAEYLYDLNDIAKDFMGYAIIYGLPYDKIKDFVKITKIEIKPGEAIVFEPQIYGDKTIYDCLKQKEQVLNRLQKMRKYYLLKKAAIFDENIYFVQKAKILNLEELLSRCDTLNAKAVLYSNIQKELRNLENENKELQQYKTKISILENKLDTADHSIKKLNKKLEKAEEQHKVEISKLNKTNDQLQIQVDYYKSLEKRPKTPKEIPAWVNEKFSKTMELHKRAIDLLEKLPAHEVDMKKMCDSLEYLASEYYLFYYAKKITEDKAFSDANLKYNQKFNVTFSGNMSIKVLPNDYKIRFDKRDGNGIKEYPLNMHLKTGVDPQFLIRIYFHYDEYNKKIIVGSLPKHLPTYTQKT